MKYLMALLFVCSPAFAGGNHITNITNNYTYNDTPNTLGMAMSAIDFDSNVTSTQMGIGGAYYEDREKTTSLAIGFGKRVCEVTPDCLLVKFTAGINEGGGSGASFGVMWKL